MSDSKTVIKSAASRPNIYLIVHGGNGSAIFFMTKNRTFTSNMKNALMFDYIDTAHDTMREVNALLRERGHELAGKVRVVGIALEDVPDTRDYVTSGDADKDTAEYIKRKTEQREGEYVELCSLINQTGGGAVVPKMFLCDPLVSSMNYGVSLDPCLLEKFLKTKQKVSVPEGKSIKDVIEEKYGHRAVELCERLMK